MKASNLSEDCKVVTYWVLPVVVGILISFLCIVSGEFDHFARPLLQLFGMVTEGGISNAGRVIKCFDMIKRRAPQNPNMDVWFLIAKLH